MRMSYANVTSSIALFLALGGTSYAVATLPKNSVGDRQLKADAVTSSKIKDGSITSRDLAAGAVTSGTSGPRGPRGEQGPTGARGPSDAFVGTGEPKSFPTSANARVLVARLTNLPAGNYLLRGNARVSNWNAGLGGALCAIVVNGNDVGQSYLPLGMNAASIASGPMVPEGTATVSDGANVGLECWFDNAIATPTLIEQARITALRVDNLALQHLP